MNIEVHIYNETYIYIKGHNLQLVDLRKWLNYEPLIKLGLRHAVY